MRPCNLVTNLTLGCISVGIEVVPARVEFTIDRKYNFDDIYQQKLLKVKKPETMNPMEAYRTEKAPEVSKKIKALKLNFGEEAALTVVCKR